MSSSSANDVNKEDECMPSSSEDSQDGVSSPMENGDEPEFSQKHYDIEPCYYSLTGKSDRNCRGKVYRYREDCDLKGFESHDGIMYRLRDSVFVEMTPNEPYVIAAICGFKYTKREHVVVKLTRYYRPDDIPDISLNLMKQERAELEINPHLCPTSLNRELFNSEIQITQPVSCLRGKCIVEYVKDVRQARTVADFSLDNDTFFFCLHYNQDSTKLASTHYAIRVGSSFQAKLPPVAKCHVGDEKDRDELLYRPECIDESTEKDYIKLARAFRVYTLSGNHMLDSQKNARVSDLLMDEAIIQLHRSGYKVDDALTELNANDIILTTDVDYMTTDDAKKFTKGIKQLGKNFSRIHRELLPHHSREQLVSYYYLWKKTPEATKPKQAARRINPTTIKRPTKEKVKVSRPTSTEYLDFDSASESDVENNGPSGRACHHCYGAESKDWHHANGLLLCTDCRVHYKKYGQLRHVANRPAQVPACLFKRSNSDEEESGVRTRAGKKEQRRRTPSSMSETPDRRSPSGTNGAPHLTAEETPTKRLNGAAKRTVKRPLHNGLLNNAEKAESIEPSSPAGSPPKLTNGLTNGHAPGPSTPNGETVTKKMKTEQIDEEDDDEEPGKMTIDEGDDEPMPVLNGFKKEEPSEEIKVELNGTISEEMPTTSNGISLEVEQSLSAQLNGEDQVEVTVENEDDEPNPEEVTKDTYVLGNSVVHQSSNALFVESFIRSCGRQSARTDMHFKLKEGSSWDKNMKEKAEKKKIAQSQKSTQEESSKLLNQHAHIKKEQQQVQQQMAAQQAQHAHMQQLQQLQAAAMMGVPPEMLRGLMPQQQFMDPGAAMLLQQMMHGGQQPAIAAALQQQLAIQQMAQHAEHAQVQHQMMRMQQEMAQQQQQAKALEQQRQQQAAAAAAREREQAARERERIQQQQQQEALRQQQQQQAAAAAAGQLNPGFLQMIAQLAAAGNQLPPEFAQMLHMHQVAAQQQQQQQQQQQREAQERERRERELREQRAREQREREEREREERERREREQQAAQAQLVAQQAAAAAAQQSMPMDQQQLHQQHQMMLLQQLMMNPHLMQQLQGQQVQQQQQAAQGTNPMAEMMRRLQTQMGPQHQ